jgi:ABC-type polysaccharide/polyol phosphate export permease
VERRLPLSLGEPDRKGLQDSVSQYVLRRLLVAVESAHPDGRTHLRFHQGDAQRRPGLVPFNFFTVAWNNGTISIANNAGLIKRIPVPREIVPIATVLSTTIHLGIQIVLLLILTLAFGRGVNVFWLWLPVLWALEVMFVCGLVLATSALDVYLRDMRYIVESACTVLFWLVPIFYTLDIVPREYVTVYEFNPLAALILGLRRILYEGVSPNGDAGLVYKLAFTSTVTFVAGLTIFSRLKHKFFDYL